jgi:hypothetical protein
MTEAKKKYDDKFLSKMERYHGISRYDGKIDTSIQEKKRKSEILFIAADLGHYIADAHMPLHTSDNHDGQLTDQKEFTLCGKVDYQELFVKDYKFTVFSALL